MTDYLDEIQARAGDQVSCRWCTDEGCDDSCLTMGTGAERGDRS